MMWHANDGMGWWMVFGGTFWVLFWVSIAYLFVRSLAQRERHHEGSGDPMEIARRRLARGEITPQQFAEIAGHLGDAPPRTT